MSRIRSRQPAARKVRRPRDSRTIPIWDETGQDNGTFYHCFWCGFTCNDGRDSIGDDETTNAVVLQDFSQTAQAEPGEYGAGAPSEYRGGGALSFGLMLDGENLRQEIVVIQSDSSGNPVEPVHYHSVSTSGGCPFCGSRNYRGDY